jgi:hypothetical protein
MPSRPDPVRAAIAALRHALTIAEAIYDADPDEARRLVIEASRLAIRGLTAKE